MVFGDHQYSGLLVSPGLSPWAAIFAAFSSLDRLGQHLLLGQARRGGRASNTLRRQALGAGYLFCCATTPLNPVQPRGSSAPGQLHLGWRCAGNKGMWAREERRTVSRGSLLGWPCWVRLQGLYIQERSWRAGGKRGGSTKGNDGQQISSPTFLLGFFSFPWL